MSKHTRHSGFRVVIEPRRLGHFGFGSVSDSLVTSGEEDRQRKYRERCEEIMADVKRHVDNVGHVGIEHDTEHVCEHCGWKWTEDSDTYNGGCCQKDEEAEQARLAATGEQP